VKKKVKVVGFPPTPDHLFVKRWNKNFFLKSMKCFCIKVFGVLSPFLQKGLSGVWGNAPRCFMVFLQVELIYYKLFC